MMKQEVLVLSATPYDFTDDRTGNHIVGVTVWLVPLKSPADQNTNGIKPVKYSLKSHQEHLFNQVTLPAYADMEFEFDFARNRISPSTFTNFESVELVVDKVE